MGAFDVLLKLLGIFLTAIGCLAVAFAVVALGILAARFVAVALCILVFLGLLWFLLWLFGVEITANPRII